MFCIKFRFAERYLAVYPILTDLFQIYGTLVKNIFMMVNFILCTRSYLCGLIDSES